MTKYRNKPTTLDGITFHSMREAAYYADLRLQERAGEIRQLELQPKFPCVVNGIKVCTYIADFRYREKNGRLRVIDVKGMVTPMFRIKKKLVEAIYPHVEIEVVK